jgi:hypothetical protein
MRLGGRLGELFVECAEKVEFPGFGFFRQGGNCALRGEDGSQRGNATRRIYQGWRLGVY